MIYLELARSMQNGPFWEETAWGLLRLGIFRMMEQSDLLRDSGRASKSELEFDNLHRFHSISRLFEKYTLPVLANYKYDWPHNLYTIQIGPQRFRHLSDDEIDIVTKFQHDLTTRFNQIAGDRRVDKNTEEFRILSLIITSYTKNTQDNKRQIAALAIYTRSYPEEYRSINAQRRGIVSQDPDQINYHLIIQLLDQFYQTFSALQKQIDDVFRTTRVPVMTRAVGIVPGVPPIYVGHIVKDATQSSTSTAFIGATNTFLSLSPSIKKRIIIYYGKTTEGLHGTASSYKAPYVDVTVLSLVYSEEESLFLPNQEFVCLCKLILAHPFNEQDKIKIANRIFGITSDKYDPGDPTIPHDMSMFYSHMYENFFIFLTPHSEGAYTEICFCVPVQPQVGPQSQIVEKYF